MDVYLDASRLGIYPPLFTSPSGDSCISFCWYIAFITQVEVLQVIYKEYTFDEFVDFSNSTFEMNWKVNNLLSEIQNVSGKVKVSWKFHPIWLDVHISGRVNLGFQLWFSLSTTVPCQKNRA